jgi:MinD superfamily P-loop ATPase
MKEEPTFLSSLAEHWQLARTLRGKCIRFDVDKCRGVWQCYEVCPMGCWIPDYEKRVVQFIYPERCIACGACVLQCPEDAIALK